jgi:DNA helicase-2/ATP-dependent DNA helicase PcrA
VLVRTNAQAAVLSEAFVGAGIPHKVRGAGSLLEQPEVKQALSELRRATSVADFLADCERTARLGEDLLGAGPGDGEAPGNGAGNGSGSGHGNGDGPRATGPGAASDARPDARPGATTPATAAPGTAAPGTAAPGAAPPAGGPAAAPPGAAGPSPGPGAGESSAPGLTEERRANIAELVRLGREYLALDPNGGTEEFGAWLRATLRDTHRSGDAVEIATFHAAKGLEWPIVHVAGLEKGYVPIHHTEEDPEAVEEERRLLYVALTRARDELHCSHATRRAFGSRSLRRQPSPWLEDLRAGLGPRPRRGASPDTAQRMARAKAGLRDRAVPRGGDEVLFQALRAWRRDQAKAAGVPAYVVFNDATLRAIAAERPTTPAQLLALPGIGAVKVERFGSDLLRIVAEADTEADTEAGTDA